MNLSTVLKLSRPIAVIDVETTGLNPDKDRICQIALTICYPVREPISWKSYINPEINIPLATTRVHGITDEMVKDAPTFAQLGPALAPKIINIDFLGYNVHFDLKFIRAEMRREKIDWDWEKNGSHVVDALRIFRIKDQRTLEVAYKKFVNAAGFDGAHDAGNDVAATAEVLAAQLILFDDIPRTVPELSDYCFPKNPDSIDKTGKLVWKGDVACINFGKWTGTSLKDLNAGYINWVLNNDFPEDFKEYLRRALNGQYPVKN